ncbi:MAG: hypothetical protein K6T86_21735 [Pirellulales bacterium]|nr:hypothetical protein [Pirellulales bacterium]
MARVLLWLMLLACLRRAAAGEEMSLTRLLEGLKAVEEHTRAFSVRCQGTHIMIYPPENPQPISLRIRYEIMQDAAGRLRWDITQELPYFRKPQPPAINWHRYLGAWDGSRAVQLQGSNPQAQGDRITRFHSADIGADARLLPTEHPLEFVSLFCGQPLTSYLESNKARLAGREVHGGREVYVLETEISEGDGQWVSRFHVVPELAFAVPYRAYLSRPSPDRPWEEVHVWRGDRYKEHPNGIWLPEYVEIGIDLRGDAFRHQLFLTWDTNPRVDDGAFVIEIPPGVMVNDRIKGEHYIHGVVNDQMIADQVAQARRLAQEYGERPASGTSARMLFAACLALLVGAGFVAYRIKRRRRASGNGG